MTSTTTHWAGYDHFTDEEAEARGEGSSAGAQSWAGVTEVTVKASSCPGAKWSKEWTPLLGARGSPYRRGTAIYIPAPKPGLVPDVRLSLLMLHLSVSVTQRARSGVKRTFSPQETFLSNTWEGCLLSPFSDQITIWHWFFYFQLAPNPVHDFITHGLSVPPGRNSG